MTLTLTQNHHWRATAVAVLLYVTHQRHVPMRRRGRGRVPPHVYAVCGRLPHYSHILCNNTRQVRETEGQFPPKKTSWAMANPPF